MGAAVGNSSPANSAWQRRVRRLFWFLGAAGTFYYISSYALDRMREARIRAVRDRKQRDLYVPFSPSNSGPKRVPAFIGLQCQRTAASTLVLHVQHHVRNKQASLP